MYNIYPFVGGGSFFCIWFCYLLHVRSFILIPSISKYNPGRKSSQNAHLIPYIFSKIVFFSGKFPWFIHFHSLSFFLSHFIPLISNSTLFPSQFYSILVFIFVYKIMNFQIQMNALCAIRLKSNRKREEKWNCLN